MINEQAEPDKVWFEIHVIYSPTDADIHLVLGRNEMDAMARLGKAWEPEKPTQGYKINKCEKYTTIITGSRRTF